MKLRAIILASILMSSAAQANNALVCTSKPVDFDGKGNLPVLSNKTEFTCNDKVKGTIPALSLAGWSIVQVMTQEDTEKGQGIYAELVIQKFLPPEMESRS